SRYHVAMLERGGHAMALAGVVAQPVEQLGKPPLGRVNAATPADGFQAGGARGGSDFAGLLPRPVVAPEIVIVDGLQIFVHRNYRGPRGIERDRFDGLAIDPRGGDGAAHRLYQRLHVIGVALRSVIRVFFLAKERILAYTRTEASPGAVEDRHAHAQCSEIDSSYDTHGVLKTINLFKPRMDTGSHG